MVHKSGLRKTRHIDFKNSLIQQHVAEDWLRVAKVGMDAYRADMLTKHLKCVTVAMHVGASASRRAMSAPWLMAAVSTSASDLLEAWASPREQKSPA